jgi:predicted ester cyclase
MNANFVPRMSVSSVVRLGVAAVAIGGVALLTAVSPVPASGTTPIGSAADLDTHPRPDARTERLVGMWLHLWNGEYTLADKIISADFQAHAAMLDGGDGSAINSPQALVTWISQTRAAIPDLHFSVQVGPLVDGASVAVRWHAQGTYAGGMPGATAPAGTKVDFTGTDTLRVANGRFAEYWLNSDTLLLLTQLQVRTS